MGVTIIFFIGIILIGYIFATFSNSSTPATASCIENENLNYLKKFPKIGDKVAKQMVLDLKGKLNAINTGIFAKEDYSNELMEVLLGLGYKQGDVKKVVSKVDTDKSLYILNHSSYNTRLFHKIYQNLFFFQVFLTVFGIFLSLIRPLA